MNINDLSDRVKYDPRTGALTRVKSHRAKDLGVITKKNNFGYIQFRIGSSMVCGHIAAWILYYGEMPNGELDHINCVRDDNRICNLREATRSQNVCNRKTKNSTGYKGVFLKKKSGRYIASIGNKNGRMTHLGSFSTAREAHIAYCLEAMELHGEFARFC